MKRSAPIQPAVTQSSKKRRRHDQSLNSIAPTKKNCRLPPGGLVPVHTSPTFTETIGCIDLNLLKHHTIKELVNDAIDGDNCMLLHQTLKGSWTLRCDSCTLSCRLTKVKHDLSWGLIQTNGRCHDSQCPRGTSRIVMKEGSKYYAPLKEE